MDWVISFQSSVDRRDHRCFWILIYGTDLKCGGVNEMNRRAFNIHEQGHATRVTLQRTNQFLQCGDRRAEQWFCKWIKCIHRIPKQEIDATAQQSADCERNLMFSLT
jgi:hypothetical protein